MAFDVAAIKRELESAPPSADLPLAVGIAIVSDTFRLAGLVPPAMRSWDTWGRKWPRAGELVIELAHAFARSSLRAETVRVLTATRPTSKATLEAFLDATSPLTAEMVRGNPFRQEEFVRHWIAACGGEIAGETTAQSQARLEQLDYRHAMSEYKKAETARKAEAHRRAQLLAEAKKRQEAAQGWRE
jgi:hypothetical protein